MADIRLNLSLDGRDLTEPMERGRYAIYATARGALVIARSGPLCETCVSCGCGEEAPPITVPSPIVAVALRAANGDIPGFLKKFTGNG